MKRVTDIIQAVWPILAFVIVAVFYLGAANQATTDMNKTITVLSKSVQSFDDTIKDKLIPALHEQKFAIYRLCIEVRSTNANSDINCSDLINQRSSVLKYEEGTRHSYASQRWYNSSSS